MPTPTNPQSAAGPLAETLTELGRLAADADEAPYDVRFENGKAYLYGGRLHAQIADFRLIRGQANARYVAAALNAMPVMLARLGHLEVLQSVVSAYRQAYLDKSAHILACHKCIPPNLLCPVGHELDDTMAAASVAIWSALETASGPVPFPVLTLRS